VVLLEGGAIFCSSNCTDPAMENTTILETAVLEGDVVLQHALGYQYLSGFLIGLGMGGVVGASTIGVAMFSLMAPEGHLNDFTAIVPVVNCVSSFVTLSVYVKNANWKLCLRMWPFITIGIALGTKVLMLLDEGSLRRASSIIYALVLLQRVVEAIQDWHKAKANKAMCGDSKDNGEVAKRAKFERARVYNSLPIMAFVALNCGIITVVTNNSGPIFNIYLLACGLDMNEFVASRSVLMAGKNLAKTLARIYSGGISLPRFIHGLQVGALSYLGVQCAKPIKARTSTTFYEYFTLCVLLYTTIKMWNPNLSLFSLLEHAYSLSQHFAFS